MRNSQIVIIGSGTAGYAMLKHLRALDATVAITVVTKDAGDYYYKPTLSNALRQQLKPEDLILSCAKEIENKYNVRYLTQTFVSNIHAPDSILSTSRGDISYTHLVLALGASPRRLIKSENSFSINNLEDFKYYYQRLQSAKHIAIVGAGFVGCELACDLAGQGYEVSIIYKEDLPMPYLEITDRKKVQLYFEQNNIHQYPSTEFNNNFDADLCISAIGLEANLTLARQANIHTHRGIVVNQFGQTNYPTIYALGDCAEFNGSVLQFIAPIHFFARAIAKSILVEKTAIELPKLTVKVKIPDLAISSAIQNRRVTHEQL